MKKTLTLFLLFICAAFVNAQPPALPPVPPPPPAETTISTTVVKEDDSPQVFTVVEQMPQFPGGDSEMMKYLGSNIKYPDMAKDCGCQGTVYLSFVIEKDGSLSGAKVLRGIKGCSAIKDDGNNPCHRSAKLMDDEALRVIKNMPKWEPGKNKGMQVRVNYNLPIKYTLR